MSSHQRWSINSIEEFIASIELDDGRVIQIPQWLLPNGAREGDILDASHKCSADGEKSSVVIGIDREATRRALEASAAQVAKTVRQPNDPGGDIQL